MGNNQCHYSNNYQPRDDDDVQYRRGKRNVQGGFDTVLERFIGRKSNRREARGQRTDQRHARGYNSGNYEVANNVGPKQGYILAVIPKNQPQFHPVPQSQPPSHLQSPTPAQHPQERYCEESKSASNPRSLYGETNPRGLYGKTNSSKSTSNPRGLYGETDNGTEEIMAVCRFCSDNIIPEFYSDHMKFCRLNPKNVTTKCEYCNQEYDLKMINNHMKTCDSKPENIKLKCEYCSQQISLTGHNYHMSRCTMNPHNVADIPTKKPLQESQINQIPECAICLLEMKDPKKIRFLGCAHKFHQECIEDWAKKSKTCPVCVTDFE